MRTCRLPPCTPCAPSVPGPRALYCAKYHAYCTAWYCFALRSVPVCCTALSTTCFVPHSRPAHCFVRRA
eukprot:3465224-Rhodomonas_salina.3